MDRRVFLAVILTAVVIVVTPLLFPGSPVPVRADTTLVDSSAAQQAAGAERGASSGRSGAAAPNAAAAAPKPNAKAIPTEAVAAESLAVESPHAVLWYSSAGAAVRRVTLGDYESRNPTLAHGNVSLESGGKSSLIEYGLRTQDSTIALSAVNFSSHPSQDNKHGVLEYTGTVGEWPVTVRYTMPSSDADRYLVHVNVQVPEASQISGLSVELPTGLVSMESDTTDDIRHLAYGYRTADGDVKSVAFGKLDTASHETARGPLDWVALRNKYFLVAVISNDSSIAGASFSGSPRVGKLAPQAAGMVLIALKHGGGSFDLYVGPQEFKRLRAVGHGLDQVNPYAGWFHSVVQPFATIVTQILLWMKQRSGLSYGWVIIIFGVAVRLLLWPLNQSAMRTSIRMQRLQPELQEVQGKYKNDPRKQQEALMKLYQAHGMTPFSPMMGCLPMLLPMPILFALYFVFLNTIEFRGVSFLWMHDISAADPYFITPLVMGVSMFVLSWIGMRGTPPTAQTRMMSYMMPVVMTFMFLRFAAGLNLYYAVQNLAAIPQQWLLARERAGATGAGTGAGGGQRNKG